ncbi:Panacea domain-containing protein [Micromonospora sp. M71_S20]|uniref:Panacea domain-containing protein n=1 Tax=Micromonospora sp. M71_S20 TaxID=592872 RepID=UPI0013155AD2|nr:type II toxin-antitoxin system antitoxin SocA domain-containing protein [Micromonospora sp. M71_S20]
MATAHDVAAAVLGDLGAMTAMKLEKLVYYCQGWHLARTGHPLFQEPIEAWREGPVVPHLYRHHRGQRTVTEWPLGDASRLATDQVDTVRWVSEAYGRFSAAELSTMTHNELPWRVARGGLPESAPSTEQVDVDLMRAYYARQVASVETAVVLASANAALEGAEFDEDWQDRLRDVASGVISADDLIAQEIARISSEQR